METLWRLWGKECHFEISIYMCYTNDLHPFSSIDYFLGKKWIISLPFMFKDWRNLGFSGVRRDGDYF